MYVIGLFAQYPLTIATTSNLWLTLYKKKMMKKTEEEEEEG